MSDSGVGDTPADGPGEPTGESDQGDGGIEKELLEGLSVHMFPTESGEVQLRFYEQTDDGTHAVLATKEKPDFFQKRQTCAEIRNRVAEEVDGHYEDQVKAEIDDLFTKMADANDEVEEAFRHPEVQELMDNTESVEVYGGENTSVELTLTWQGSTKTLIFSNGEWTSPSAHKFKQKFFNEFFQTPKLQEEHWFELREFWEAEATIEMEDAQTTSELIAEEVVETLAKKLNAYADREMLKKDKETAWFDRNNSAGRAEVPADSDVVWVRSTAVRDALREAGKETSYMNQLSKALKQNGYTFGASTPMSAGYEDDSRWQKKCYPFMPTALGMTEHSIQDYDPEDDEDDGDGDGADSDGDDGSDDDDGRGDKEVVPDGGPGYGPHDHRRSGDRTCESLGDGHSGGGRLMTDGGQPSPTVADGSVPCPSCERSFETDHGMKVHHTQAHGESLAKLKRSCKTCGVEFEVFQSRADNGRGDFCSRECYDKSGRQEAECGYCGSHMVVQKHRAQQYKTVFCSDNCESKWKSENSVGEDHHQYDRVRVKCGSCGERFELPPSLVNPGDDNFCSRDCYGAYRSETFVGSNHPNWTGGPNYYGPNWKTQRRRALEDSGYKCRVCGMSNAESEKSHSMGLDVHHVVPIREFDTPEDGNSLENLVVLCRSCHMKYEGHPVIPKGGVA